MNDWNCPQSVSGHDADRVGKCHWCGKKVTSPVPAPTNPKVTTYSTVFPKVDWVTLEPIDPQEMSDYE